MSEQAEITITKEDFRRIGYEVIPRAQHEALMAAANDIYGLEKHFNKPAIRNEPLLRIVGVRNTIEQRAAALRAAGIDPSEDQT